MIICMLCFFYNSSFIFRRYSKWFEIEKRIRKLLYSMGKRWNVLCYKQCSEEDRSNFRFEPNYKVNQIFPRELEDELKKYLIEACKMHHGLTKKNVINLAYELGKRNNLRMPDSWERHQQAGVDWLYGYMKRYPALSLRKPEATSLGRATSFNRTTVNEFYDNLCRAYNKFPNGAHPESIYNLDETALTTVHNPPNIIGQKGLKQIGQVTSGERGVLVTACCFINATGNSVPPFLVFPRVHFKDRMLTGAPPGAGGSAAKTGWVNGEVFADILKHFQRFAKASNEAPILLIMDNHESHITITSLEFCKNNGIILLTLPPHTSGKLQPLDKTVYKSLKTNFNQTCNDWMVMIPGKTITIYEIAGLFGKAYPLTFTPSNIINGFRSTGIWPLNRDVYTDDDFLASAVTDRPQPSLNQKTSTGDKPDNSETPLIESTEEPLQDVDQDMVYEPPLQTTPRHSPISLSQLTPEPSTSRHSRPSVLLQSNIPFTSLVMPIEVRPHPKASERKNKKTRTRKSEILTETPIKDQIIADINIRKNKVTKNVFKPKKSKFEKKIQQHSSSEDGSFSCAESDASIGPFISEDEEQIDFDQELELKNEDYVLIKEGITKGHEVMSIGQIKNTSGSEINVVYIRRLYPSFKFVRTLEEYTFELAKVLVKLPTPKPSGGTARRSEMLTFPVDFSEYYKFAVKVQSMYYDSYDCVLH